MATSKYQKVNYCIIGRYPAGRKYGIITKMEVSGYAVDGVDGIAISKRGGWWYVDHIKTGLGIVTVGSKTRDAALDEYLDHFLARVQAMRSENLRNAAETLDNTPLESDVEKWESANFCTTSNHRLDKITDAAKRSGLIVKKADDINYLDGGNINIIGDPAALEVIREMIAAWNKADTERPEIISSDEDAAETVQEDAAAIIAAEPDAAQDPEAPTPAGDPKQARGPVPEKTFIGSVIQGAGWKIIFDAAANRTRVIFEKDPAAAARAAVENAGFYYSRNMHSWNKKLTFKAYRAAQKLAAELNRIMAA